MLVKELYLIARPFGVYYGHFVSPSIRPSVRGQLVKKLIALEPQGIFSSNFAYLCMVTLSNHRQPILIDEGLLSIIPAGCGQLVKMLITLEPHGIFGSNHSLHAYFFYIV